MANVEWNEKKRYMHVKMLIVVSLFPCNSQDKNICKLKVK